MSYTIDDAIEELLELSIETPNKIELPDSALISEYEELLGVEFPDDYKKFLLTASNVFVGALSPAMLMRDHDLYNDLVAIAKTAKSMGVAAELIPFCEDNGDYYCLTKEGSIKFWSHDGYTNETWPDLAMWIKQVWIEEE